MLNNNNYTKIKKLELLKERIIKEMSKCNNEEKLKMLNNNYMEIITSIYKYKYILN